jgi:hypothetical protein
MASQRVEYENRLQTFIEKLDRDLWRLREEAHQTEGIDDTTKAALDGRIEVLAAQQRLARETLHRLQEADDSEWQSLLPDVERTWRRLSEENHSGYGVF